MRIITNAAPGKAIQTAFSFLVRFAEIKRAVTARRPDAAQILRQGVVEGNTLILRRVFLPKALYNVT